ncbi:hypothetical protein [Methylosinus sp. Sm6]|uniref:hypothetical protein n=1 Tax=Methylosinus sp. Sm6 TaxID=2866948 RepID=UPI001C99D2FA|nr:hypothetical protein [Methylosinus sp. Sm6]MBY6241404.1 hypothetical protein [Methylosinus sp. Sm6]
MRTLRPPPMAVIALAAALSGCADAYETFGPPAAAVGKNSPQAEKRHSKKAGKASRAKMAEGEKAAKQDEPPPTGACITFQFLGGADCVEATKRDCYDKRMNVADWREDVACSQAALSGRAAASGRGPR